MIVFFSVKTAIFLAIVAAIVGFYFRPPLWFMQLLDIISIGFGTMMQGVRMWIFGILAIALSHYANKLNLYLFPEIFTDRTFTLFFICILFLFTIFISELLADQKWNNDIEYIIRKCQEEGARMLEMFSVHSAATGSAYVASQIHEDNSWTSSNSTSYSSHDDEFDRGPAYASYENRFYDSDQKETDLLFEQMEEQRRIDEMLRIQREMDEMNRFNDEMNQFNDESMSALQDSMDDMNHFQEMHDDFSNTMDRFDDMNDYYHSNDDYDSYDDHHY